MARPVYDRKSKLLFFEKMVNFDNSFSDNDRPTERKKTKGKSRANKLKLRGHDKCKIASSQDVCNSLKESVSTAKDFHVVIETLVDEEVGECHSSDVDVLHHDMTQTEQVNLYQHDNINTKNGDNNLDVTIFAYKCQTCKKHFATMCMLQEHNISQCGQVQREKKKENSKYIKCNLCTDSTSRQYTSHLAFKHHMQLCHKPLSGMNEVSKRVYVKCGVCYAKRIFVYYSSLKMHLWKKHQINVSLKECSDYAIKKTDHIGSARTRAYLGRIRKDKCVEPSPSQNIESGSEFFICRVCDKPFSESLPFLNHYRSHSEYSALESESQSEIRRSLPTDKSLNSSCGESYVFQTDKDCSASNAVAAYSENVNFHLEMESSNDSIESTPIDVHDFEYSQLQVKMEPYEDPDYELSRIGDKKREPNAHSDWEHSGIRYRNEPGNVLHSKNSTISVYKDLKNSKTRVCMAPDDSPHSKHSRINVKINGDIQCVEDSSVKKKQGDSFDLEKSEISVCGEPNGSPNVKNSRVNIEPDCIPNFKDSRISHKIESNSVVDSVYSRLKSYDGLDANHSRISVNVEGFEIELDQPTDYTGNDAIQHKEQLHGFDMYEHEFICKMCYKSFSNYVELLCHNEIHEEQKTAKKKNNFRYSCPECSRTFSTAMSYRVHIKTHGKVSTCGVCGILFESMDSLKEHVELHSMSRHNVDNKSSKTKSKNYRKQEKVVEKPKCRICLICSKTFLTLSSYTHHMTRHGIIKRPVLHTKAKRRAMANKHKFSDPVLEKKIENDDVTMFMKDATAEQQCETNVNTLHLATSIQNVCPVTEHNFESSGAIQIPFEEDYSTEDNAKKTAYNTTGSKVQKELLIFNAFSLTDERFANIEIFTQTPKECEFGVKQQPDSKTQEYDKHEINVYSRLVSMTKQKDTSNLQCEVCSKNMPSLAFKRIHMLLHRKTAPFKH